MIKKSRFVLFLVLITICVTLVSCEMKLGLEDYGITVDPSPTTKTSLKPGPIEHGAPIGPYIPFKPPPPPSSPPPEAQEGG
ncbi:hypothetical protein AALP_AA8G002900 [Arabis alpina]|uniref:Uncharacterized protein n=1 Tax=Arabis alpina TaxID=50452 RepID=A0A087G419_ARAAL|nr:hypothetical protein AALP_AA8G002900 [Arabis alpina]